ncbi:MAG: primosomal replication protein PriB [Pseudomonadota bacterium]|jgi:primosomal replication protein N
MNRLVLSATLAERAALRFTPAGLPALDLVLAHESELVHEGQARKVSMQLKALAIGSTVSAVASMSLGSLAQFVGFVAPARNGRGWLFHITEVHG